MSRKKTASAREPLAQTARDIERRAKVDAASSSARVATLLAFASALAAGTHEVAWARLLGRATGNTTFGVGLALTAFMVGSGGGALVAPRLSLFRRPRAAYAIAEVLIGIGAALLALYCLCASPPSVVFAIDGRVGLGLDVLAASALALLPATAMGATYPLLVEMSGREVRRLYAAGLVGAVIGTLVTALLIAPRFGLDAATMGAAAINAAIALAAWKLLPRDAARRETPVPVSVREDRDAIVRFAAAGVLGLAAQVVWNRVVVPYAGVSVFTFASIVAAYVLAQAAGFAVHARLREDRRERAGALALAATPAVAIGCLGVLAWFGALPSRDGAPSSWFLAAGGVVLAVVGPTACLLGVAQASALARVETYSEEHGRRAGAVAGFGTLASALGALASSALGIVWLGPRGTIVAAGLGAVVVLALSRERALAAISLGGALALAVLAPGPAWFLGPSFDDAPRYYAEHGVEDTTAVVAIDRPVEPRIRRLVSNGVSYSGDSIYAQRYMRLLAHLPALAARGEERALVICIGTGTTLDALRTYDYRRIDAVDISPSVADTLRFFDHVNHHSHRDERVRVIVDDGARYLRRTDARYDVITLEPPPPRAPSASALYSLELYEAARARLRPGGAIAQWLPLHGMSGAELAALVRTFASVFETTTLHLSERNEAVLLGVLGDGARTHAPRRSRADVARDLAAIGLADQDPLEDTFVMDGPALRALVGTGPVVRDAWPMPEYAPLAGANERAYPADRFVERIVRAARPRRGSFAAMVLPAVPGFLRMERGAGRGADGATLARAMQRWRERSPTDPYVQHVFQLGPLLEARLDRVASEMPPVEVERIRQLIRRRERDFHEQTPAIR